MYWHWHWDVCCTAVFLWSVRCICIRFALLHCFSCVAFVQLFMCLSTAFSSFEMCSCSAYEGPALDLLTFLTFLFVVINFWSFALMLSMLQRFPLYDTSYAGTDFDGDTQRLFFCKTAVRRSKYFLEISKAREKRKLSGCTFQFRLSCFVNFLLTYIRFLELCFRILQPSYCDYWLKRSTENFGIIKERRR